MTALSIPESAGESYVGRKINTAWFGHYRVAEQALPACLAAGEHRADVIARHAHAAGLKDASFVRVMKAGRYLDSECHELSPDAVRCSYMQADLLEKISRINKALAAEQLPGVLSNTVSLDELKALYASLREQDLTAKSIISRDDARRLTTSHERNCTQAIARAGAAFFGAPKGQILRQTKGTEFVAPHYLVMDKERPHAAVIARVGGRSKSATAMAFELLYLALALRNWVPNIWFVFPEINPVAAKLAALSVALKASPKDQNWLHIAELEPTSLELKVLKRGRYLALGMHETFHHLAQDFGWDGKDLKTGQECSISLIKPPEKPLGG